MTTVSVLTGGTKSIIPKVNYIFNNTYHVIKPFDYKLVVDWRILSLVQRYRYVKVKHVIAALDEFKFEDQVVSVNYGPEMKFNVNDSTLDNTNHFYTSPRTANYVKYAFGDYNNLDIATDYRNIGRKKINKNLRFCYKLYPRCKKYTDLSNIIADKTVKDLIQLCDGNDFLLKKKLYLAVDPGSHPPDNAKDYAFEFNFFNFSGGFF